MEPFSLKGAFILIRSLHVLLAWWQRQGIKPRLLQVSLGTSSLNTIFIGDGHNTKWPATALQNTNRQLPISDRELILQKHQTRNANHASSKRSKAPHLKYSPNPSVEVGDLVYLYCDRNKSKARNRYLVVSADGEWCQIRKFVGNQLRQSSYKVKRSECYLFPPTMLNLQYTSDSESEEEEPIEVSHHQDSQPKKLPSYPDNIPPTPLEIMSPLPHTYANEDNSIDPDVPEAPLDPPENPPCSTSQLPTSTRPQRTKRLPSRFKDFEM